MLVLKVLLFTKRLLFSLAVNQCQLVKNSEKRINGLNIGIKSHSEMKPEVNGMDSVIFQAMFLFYCMANKQV